MVIIAITVLTETGGKTHFCVFQWLNDNGDPVPGASGAGSMRCSAALHLQPRGHPSGTPRRAFCERPAARRASQVLNRQGALGLLIRAGCMSFEFMRRGAASFTPDMRPC